MQERKIMNDLMNKIVWALMLVWLFGGLTVTYIFAVTEIKPNEETAVVSTTETTVAASKADNVDPQGTYLGKYKVTAYCSCQICCGKYAKNRPTDKDGNEIVYTASGEIAKQGITIAADKSIPFGTQLTVGNKVYVVQDRGGAVGKNCLDIYFNSHDKAKEWGVKCLDVYMK